VKCLQDELSELRAEIRRHATTLAEQGFANASLPSPLAEALAALCRLGSDPAPTGLLPQVCEVLPDNRAGGVTFRPRACFKSIPPSANDPCDSAGCRRFAETGYEACSAYPGWLLFLCPEHFTRVQASSR
jgi:hypothetical protein